MTRFALALLLVSSAAAGEDARPPELKRQWLHRLVGSWAVEGRDAGGQAVTGSVSARTLRGRWLVAESELDAPGGPATVLQTVGYNAETGRYVGTQIDAADDRVVVYDGELSADGRTLSLLSEVPGAARRRDAYTVESPDRVTLLSEAESADGRWTTLATATLTRAE